MHTHIPFLLQANGFAQHKADWFLLGLMSAPRLPYLEDLNLPPPPTGKSEVDVVADYLFKLRDAIFPVLRSSFDMEKVQIQWWFTIPLLWDSIGKSSLRSSALQAGFIRGGHDDEIFFIAKPVAYVLNCYRTRLIQPRPSDTFLVVVAGKATVDLVTYEVSSGHPLVLKQLTSPSTDVFCG